MPLRYADLREFLQYLEGRDQLRRIDPEDRRASVRAEIRLCAGMQVPP